MVVGEGEGHLSADFVMPSIASSNEVLPLLPILRFVRFFIF